MIMRFADIPSDIILIIVKYLSAQDIAALAQTSKVLHSLVKEYGWSIHVRCTSWPLSWSLQKSFAVWDAYSIVRYHTLTDHHWAHHDCIARPLSRKWSGKLQPLLASNASRLFVGAGNTIYSYAFTAVKPGNTPGIQFEGSFTTTDRLQARRDITSMVTVPDGGLDRTLYIGYHDGALECIQLPFSEPGQERVSLDLATRDRCQYYGDDIVESISTADRYLLALSAGGTAAFLDLSAPSEPPQLVDLKTRGWAAYVSAQGTPGYAAFGLSSSSPLVVHDIQPSGLSEIPSVTLSSGSTEEPRKPSAVYGICGAPPSFPWGASNQIIVSGWYDGLVRVHDLRADARKTSYPNGPGALTPVLAMYDPWTFEPNYCVACGGGSSSHIAAGTARHSVVALWDVRNAKGGWSVHGPGNDSSPVYSIILESSRLFGATQSRPFVLDFGPDSREETYPPLHFNHREENLRKRDKSGIGFYVTKYSHGR